MVAVCVADSVTASVVVAVPTDAAADGCMAVAGHAVGWAAMNSAQMEHAAAVAVVTVQEAERWFNANFPRPVRGLA